MRYSKTYRRGAAGPVRHTAPPRPPSSSCKSVISLDTQSIRKKALKDYQKAERSLEQLKAQIKRYHERDIPGFRSWLHQAFGTLLSKQREISQQFHAKRQLLMEVEELVFRYDLSDIEAYRKAIWRRDHPKEAEEEDLQYEQERQARRARAQNPDLNNADDDDDSDPFDESFGDGADEDFDSVPDDEWENFSDFFENATGQRPPPRGARPSQKEDKSAKEVYRTIVRRLHPDHHGHMSEARKNLWHEAQAAYRNHDTQALYNILARCEGGEAGLGTHSPVSLIHNLTAQMKRALQSTRSKIRHTKSDPAWDYETKIKNHAFVRNIQQSITGEVRAMQHDLDEINSLLSELEWHANHSPPTRTKKARRNRKTIDDGLDWLFQGL